MQAQLLSSFLKVSINKKGAELNSVRNKNGVEYIWQADKEIWPRHAPVLFPVVGKLKDNKFFYDGRTYELPQHGFARDMKFEVISSDNDSCTFSLSSSEQTKNKYPFDFVFEITYQLKNSTLTTSYKIKNPSSFPLYFSVGAHPGFNCPLLPGEKFEDYYLEFEGDAYEQTLLSDGLLSNGKTGLKLSDKHLPLSVALFDKDALVFENNQINKISLRSKNSSHSITMDCKDWPFFGIWSKKGCDRFVCLEPWFGIADKTDSSQQLSDKKGISELKPGGEFTCSFSCSFC